MDKNTEQEWQFAASGLDAARAWLAAQPANPSERRLAARPTLELTDTYYDSAGLDDLPRRLCAANASRARGCGR